MDRDVGITDCNIFRCDRQRKEGGVSIYERFSLMASCSLNISVPKICELLVIKVAIRQYMHIFIAAVYRHPDASAEAVGII